MSKRKRTMDLESYWLLSCILVGLQFDSGDQLSMLTDGQFHVHNIGDSSFLECSFRADQYNLFDYPVIWRKQQQDEMVQMNVMGSLNEPFVSSNRFEVTFSSNAPRYHVELTILDLSREDSGNYTCEIRGPQSVLLGQVTHYVFVRVPAEKLLLLDDTVTENSSTLPTTIHLEESHPCRIRCITLGGYPPPNIELSIGHRDITGEFLFRNNVTMAGTRGMRTLTYRTERWTNNYLPRADDNDQLLKCTALVPGMNPLIKMITLDVAYSPKILCMGAHAYLWDTDVCLHCEVRAKPRVSSLFWIIDANGTMLAEGEVVDDLWVISKDRLDGAVDIQLCIRRARPLSFRQYTLVAENSLAIQAKDVQLFQKFKSPSAAGPLSDKVISAAGHLSSRGRGNVASSRSDAMKENGSDNRINDANCLTITKYSITLVSLIAIITIAQHCFCCCCIGLGEPCSAST